MGNCFSADHSAEDNIHTGITLRNDNRSTALERSVISYFGDLLTFQNFETNLGYFSWRLK